MPRTISSNNSNCRSTTPSTVYQSKSKVNKHMRRNLCWMFSNKPLFVMTNKNTDIKYVMYKDWVDAQANRPSRARWFPKGDTAQ